VEALAGEAARSGPRLNFVHESRPNAGGDSRELTNAPGQTGMCCIRVDERKREKRVGGKTLQFLRVFCACTWVNKLCTCIPECLQRSCG